jgi:DNA-binding response OmpR family regulator
MFPMSILLVDDEHDLVWALSYSLRDEGYEVLTANDGAEAIAIARRHQPDLIILDIMMPGLNGLQVCHNLRRDAHTAATPILFLTGRSDVEDRVAGLNEGGDDYLVKPFDLRELKARIGALLRRRRATGGQPSQPHGCLMVGPLTLNVLSRQLWRGEAAIQLTQAEADLLSFLMRHPGQVFSSYELLERVWNYPRDIADPSLVRWHMKNLRAKIEPEPARPVYIRTVPHQGYILNVQDSLHHLTQP